MRSAPDLTEAQAPPPAAADRRPQSSITSFSISPVRQGVIWAGTNNARHSANRGRWSGVARRVAARYSRARDVRDRRGRPSRRTDRLRRLYRAERRPPLHLSHARCGATWTLIVRGLPDDAFARVVREDPVVPGLLYCGTESGVYMSIDAGDTWQSLQLNLPASSMRDLACTATISCLRPTAEDCGCSTT